MKSYSLAMSFTQCSDQIKHFIFSCLLHFSSLPENLCDEMLFGINYIAYCFYNIFIKFDYIKALHGYTGMRCLTSSAEFERLSTRATRR